MLILVSGDKGVFTPLFNERRYYLREGDQMINEKQLSRRGVDRLCKSIATRLKNEGYDFTSHSAEFILSDCVNLDLVGFYMGHRAEIETLIEGMK